MSNTKDGYIDCPEHGRHPAWIVCTHVLHDNASCRIMVRRQGVGGDMICKNCWDRSMADDAAGRMDISYLHSVCEAHLRSMTPHLDDGGNVIE